MAQYTGTYMFKDGLCYAHKPKHSLRRGHKLKLNNLNTDSVCKESTLILYMTNKKRKTKMREHLVLIKIKIGTF